jgi:hypothetical protein
MRPDRLDEIAERDIFVLFLGLVVDIKEKEDDEDDEKPDKYPFVEGVQVLILGHGSSVLTQNSF